MDDVCQGFRKHFDYSTFCYAYWHCYRNTGCDCAGVLRTDWTLETFKLAAEFVYYYFSRNACGGSVNDNVLCNFCLSDKWSAGGDFGIRNQLESETVRSGIMAVDMDAKDRPKQDNRWGLGSAAVMRLIVLPQAIKNILPALGNEFIALLKETSVVGYITIVDVTRVADLVRSRTYDQFFPLLVVAVIYLVFLVIGITQLLKIAERRLAKSDRR